MIVEGTPPERFALEHAHYDEDIPFWTRLARETGGPVLDIGAAVGRVALPIARCGLDVCALDGSQGMLHELAAALAREPEAVRERVTLHRSDFRDIALDSRFALAVMPMNSLQALLTRDDQLACMSGVRRALTPEGVFAFDVAVPDLEAIAGSLDRIQPGATWQDPVTGTVVTHASWFEAVERETGTVSFTTRIEERSPGGAVTEHLRPHTVHLFTPTELWELLQEAGFEVQAVLGDFDGTPFSSSAERQIYRCGVAA